jgi:hypothetical protein
VNRETRMPMADGRSVIPDSKPPKRYRASQAEWSAIHETFKDERCWVCNDIWTDLHHILPRGSQSGDDVVVNLAPVCRKCHALVEAHDPFARAQIRGALMPSHIAYLRYRLGDGVEAWLDRYYPRAQVVA